ncbi:uncharacterized protein LOC123873892 isoform X2 [Maniola jurtina]|uniref:uncharacterized protein LOC123873892 isoform X1 n=1 Tax=Maniola jurtina TaxID=191418 RepID=UPI001E68BEDC|nr:uncharacterized protein LOC123873892 isoform X1 [Maniola jurtina]XP_045774947.1 uncharacterized protein LOC123873892 isoform X2 [Maniola jurtina]
MAEAALARREARRRKILENSHNRLQLIAGKSDNEICKESSIITQIPSETTDNSVPKESSSTSKCLLNNGVINAGEDLFGSLPINHESFALGDGDVTIRSHDTAALLPPSSTTSTPDPVQVAPSLWETITNLKYDIVLLSMFIQLLHGFSLITFEGMYFFLPLISYVATKYFWSPKQHNNSNIANALLLLNGMSARKAQNIMSIIQCVSTFSQDVCIFLFTTICIQSLLLTIKANLL